MLRLLLFGLMIFIGTSSFGQCDSKVRTGKIKVLTIAEDINKSSGSIGVVGIAEEDGYPYYFEIRLGNEKGKIVQSGEYLKKVQLENNKYPILEIQDPGNYVIITCNLDKKNILPIVLKPSIK